MATTTSITTTYAGEFAGKYIAAALLSADTLDKGLVEIKPNVKYKEVIKKVEKEVLEKVVEVRKVKNEEAKKIAQEIGPPSSRACIRPNCFVATAVASAAVVITKTSSQN